MGVPVGELKPRLTEREFRTYAAYLSHEPTAADRADWWGAHILTAFVNANRASGQSPVRIADVLPARWGRKPPSERDLVSKLRAWGMGAAAASRKPGG